MKLLINFPHRNRKIDSIGPLLVGFVFIFGSVYASAQEPQPQQEQQEEQAVEAYTYKLAPGDLLDISVYEEPELSFVVRLGEQGVISYPFIGDVAVSGRTTTEVENSIREKLISGEFLIRPEVNVNIAQYRPFYIEGQVNAPGSYPFEPGLTLRKAVSMAGSYTERASRSNITIVRNQERVSISSNLLDEPIQPDDIITVAERFF